MVFNKSVYGVFVLMGFCAILSVSVFADPESGGWHISNCPENYYLESHICDQFTYYFEVSGPIDEPHHFELLSGPGVMFRDGQYRFTEQTTNQTFHIEVGVFGEDGRGDKCSFAFTAINEGPQITNCPDSTVVATVNVPFTYNFDWTDDYPCGHYTWTILDDDGILGDLSISEWGVLEFVPDSADIGSHTVSVAASDPFDQGTPCTITFRVKNTPDVTMRLMPEDELEGGGVLLGQVCRIDVVMDSTDLIFGGFQFAVTYPAAALSLVGVDESVSAAFAVCDWEYFTYRLTYPVEGWSDPVVTIFGIAETNNGITHPVPNCHISGPLCSIRFYLTNDQTYECTVLPVWFYWLDCSSNALANSYGDTLYIARRVFDFFETTDTVYQRIDDTIPTMPTRFGFQPDECPPNDPSGYTTALSTVDFYNGYVEVVCAAEIDPLPLGDLNFDFIPFTTADAVLYTNYFVYGMAAFIGLPPFLNENHIVYVSDINQDGLGLTLADLVLLIQIGRDRGTIPYNLNAHSETDASIKYDNDRLWVSAPCAAAHIVVLGEIEPTLLASNMTMLTGFDGEYTRILVFSMNPANTFDGTFLILDGDVLALTMVDASGVQFAPTLVPTTWSLSQNYPNPFNPITTIEFSLPKRTHIDLEIFNVTGQRVGLTSGVFGPGEFQTTWDGSDHASGVYWYRLTADGFSQSRKMLLIK